MKLLFRQRIFSWFDSYDIYDEYDQVAYTVKGVPAWGHRLCIFAPNGEQIGEVKEELFTLMPRFQMYVGGNYIGEIRREFTFFKPKYILDCNGWEVNGDILEWEYTVTAQGRPVMTASKQLFQFSDTYVIDIADPNDALLSLMIVLAIDAAQCSKD